MVDIIMPNSTSRQLANRDFTISEAVERCGRARNSLVSSSERRKKSSNGSKAHPAKSAMRHPQRDIWLFESMDVSAMPSSAANITATCWLADCQLTYSPFRLGGAISET